MLYLNLSHAIVPAILASALFAAKADSQQLSTKFNSEDIAFCGLLTPTEISEFTGHAVVEIRGTTRECTWKLSGSGNERITILARYERELPSRIREIGLEGIGRLGKNLAQRSGPADLIMAEIDKGVVGVHAVCYFYLFSLDLSLTSIDLEAAGRELGKRALRRFNGGEERCFVSKVLKSQFPGDW